MMINHFLSKIPSSTDIIEDEYFSIDKKNHRQNSTRIILVFFVIALVLGVFVIVSVKALEDSFFFNQNKFSSYNSIDPIISSPTPSKQGKVFPSPTPIEQGKVEWQTVTMSGYSLAYSFLDNAFDPIKVYDTYDDIPFYTKELTGDYFQSIFTEGHFRTGKILIIVNPKSLPLGLEKQGEQRFGQNKWEILLDNHCSQFGCTADNYYYITTFGDHTILVSLYDTVEYESLLMQVLGTLHEYMPSESPKQLTIVDNSGKCELRSVFEEFRSDYSVLCQSSHNPLLCSLVDDLHEDYGNQNFVDNRSPWTYPSDGLSDCEWNESESL